MPTEVERQFPAERAHHNINFFIHLDISWKLSVDERSRTHANTHKYAHTHAHEHTQVCKHARTRAREHTQVCTQLQLTKLNNSSIQPPNHPFFRSFVRSFLHPFSLALAAVTQPSQLKKSLTSLMAFLNSV